MVRAKSLYKKARKLRKKGEILRSIDLLEKSLKLYPSFQEACVELLGLYEMVGDEWGVSQCKKRLEALSSGTTLEEAASDAKQEGEAKIEEVQVEAPRVRELYDAMTDLEEAIRARVEKKEVKRKSKTASKKEKMENPATKALREKIRASIVQTGKEQAHVRQKLKDYLHLALFFESVDELEKAIEIMEKIIMAEKTNPKIWERLGLLYAKVFRFGEALYCFKRANLIEITPEREQMIEALKKLAFPHKPLEKTKTTEAERFYNMGIKLYIQQNDLVRALYYIKKAIDLDPKYENAWIVEQLKKQHERVLAAIS